MSKEEKMKTEHFLYGGTFDDRYTSFADSRRIDYRSYRRMILQSFFNGQTLLLNDGYIHQHPEILRDMEKEGVNHASMLSALAKAKQVAIAKRIDVPLEELPFQDDAPDSLVDKHRDLVRENKWNDVRKGLVSLDKKCGRSASWSIYDKDVAFCRTMGFLHKHRELLRNKVLEEQFHRCFEAFCDYVCRRNRKKPRTTWEIIVKGDDPAYLETSGESKEKSPRPNPNPPMSSEEHADPKVRERLMTIANLAYSYAFVACYRKQEIDGTGIRRNGCESQTLAFSPTAQLGDLDSCLFQQVNMQEVDIKARPRRPLRVDYPALITEFCKADSLPSTKEYEDFVTLAEDSEWRQKRYEFSSALNQYCIDPKPISLGNLKVCQSSLNDYVRGTLLKKVSREFRRCVPVVYSQANNFRPSFVSPLTRFLCSFGKNSCTVTGIALGLGGLPIAAEVVSRAPRVFDWGYGWFKSIYRSFQLEPTVFWTEGGSYKKITSDLPRYADVKETSLDEKVLFPTF